MSAGGGQRVFWWVLGLTLLAIVASVWFSDRTPPHMPKYLPWEIQPLAGGTSRVFGIELGRSPLSALEQALEQPAEVSLFAQRDGRKSLEAYFDSVTLAGIKARMVVVLGMDQALLQKMFDRGARIATLPSGQRKVTLSDPDLLLAREAPVAAITFLPRSDLDEATVRRRFGDPAEKIAEPSGEVVHWLYPPLGLDIAIGAESLEVFQYVPPKDFARLTAPLYEALQK